jgi:hypothetical protein
LNNLYLARYAWPVEYLKTHIPAYNLGLIIVIPSCGERNLPDTFLSIKNCKPAGCNVEVIVVVNHPESSPDEIVSANMETIASLGMWTDNAQKSWLQFHFIRAFDLPSRKAGVGLARKIGMDEAVRRFHKINNPNGIIACLDADCLCDPNYLYEIHKHFKKHPETTGACVYFEHPLEGKLPEEIYEGIAAYELHLRYMVHALRMTGYPYSFHTVGSSMVINSEIYQKQGGMNTRKAGEDFYFLHKIFPLGHFHEINSTRVIPSPRVSERVPFGTGKAMKEWISTRNLLTYNPLIYKDLTKFINDVNLIYERSINDEPMVSINLPESLKEFLREEEWAEKIKICLTSSRNERGFKYHFYKWFSGLKIIKYLNFAANHFYPDVPLEEAAKWVLSNQYGIRITEYNSNNELLELFRHIDRKGN